jgi:hypothetical protein
MLRSTIPHLSAPSPAARSTSITQETSMKSTRHISSTAARTFDTITTVCIVAIAGLLVLAAAAMAAPASAQSARARATPAQAKPHSHEPLVGKLNTSPASGVTTARNPHAPQAEKRIVDTHGVAAPHGRGPRSEGGKYGIIFVGGRARSRVAHDKTAINSQPVPSGHALHGSPQSPLSKTALNPQPIPPGHAL